jgi:hypothetical protein
VLAEVSRMTRVNLESVVGEDMIYNRVIKSI